MPGISDPAISGDVLEEAAQEVEKLLIADAQYAELSGKLRVTSSSIPTGSGKSDYDYPALTATIPSLETLPFYSQVQRTPLPPDLVEQFDQMQCNCSMGLFPNINRVWMSIDTNIYLWSYIDGGDLAYFDGLTEVILTAGLVLPKPGIFQEHIRFLLVLTTPVDIVILGVSFTVVGSDCFGEMHLQPEPLFTIPSDNVNLLSITGSQHGRIFAAGKDGCLYEIVYQAEDGWFSQKCRKVNHSISRLSFLVPSFLSFSDEDPLVQIAIDESRNILYSRSEKGIIQVFDLGQDGAGMSRVAQTSTDSYVINRACQVVGMADRKLFTPIVHIAPIMNTESYTLHLVAITQAGVRLYFTTTPDGQQGRPVLLAMVHARLPPGFSPSSTMLKPGNTIHLAHYRRGTLLLASSQMDSKDLLLSVDPDIFPFQCLLTESQVSFTVDGRSWAIAEMPNPAEPFSSPHPLPPAIVTQHVQQQRRFVLLTAQGTYMLDKLHPVDQLRTVLEGCKGTLGEAVDGFCRLFKQEQVCAMCLILATRSEQQIAMWATELFFQFGGEPHFVFPTSAVYQSPQTGHASTQMMSPSVYSIPTTSYASPSVLGRAIMGPELVMSGRHQGLCLYLSRLISPFWNVPVVKVFSVPGQKEVQFHSTFSQEHLAMFSEHLNALRSFIERNPQLMAASPNDSLVQNASPNVHQRLLNFMRPEGMSTASPLHIQQSLQAKYRNEAFSRERKSIQQVCQLVIKICESLALWKLLSENQLQLTTAKLKQPDKDQLRNTTFKMFVTSGKQMANAMITSLMNHFAGDTVMTDNLVKRLRELAPTVYSEDDAIASKANELVMLAKSLQTRYDQVTMLRESLQLYCKVAHQVNLGSVCGEYQAVQYYDAVVEVCLCAANQKDPQELALHHYKSGHPESDVQGRNALNDRMNCYNHITGMLQQLLNASQSPAPPTLSPVKPGPPSTNSANQNQQPPNPKEQLEEILKLSLQSDDELFHVTLYSWMKARMPERLVEIQSPFVETFLKQMATDKDDIVDTLNLLWKYYEKNREYFAAAQVLERLAAKPGTEQSLEQRIECLSRAVMCSKCCNLATTTSNEGEFLHELEERLEVARLQLQVLHAIAALPRSHETTTALDILNADLMDLSKLYGEFAEVFDLYECKLAIVHCAGHEDAALVDSLWQNIINKEAQSTTVDSESTPRSLKTKLVTLGQTHYPSEKYFPLSRIIKLLEQLGCQKNWNVKFVYQTMREIGVSFVNLLPLYDYLFKARDPVWQSLCKPLHILNVIQYMLCDYVSSPSSVAAYERQPFIAKALSHISTYLMELTAMETSIPGHHEIQSSFRRLQNQLQNF